jgi:putative transposase
LRAYRALFELAAAVERDDEVRAATNGNFALGGDEFKRQFSAALGRRAARGTPGRPSRSVETNADQLDLLGEQKKNVVCP